MGEKTGKTRAVGYIRVSSDRQEISLEAQRAKLDQYAELYDVEILEVCQDEITGSRRNRPGLKRALSMLRDGKAEAIVVWKLDRLTRSLGHLTEMLDEYFSNGWKLLSVTEQLDTKSASGRMIINILGTVNQWYREDVGEKTAVALQHKKSKGEKTGGALPFGKRLGRDGKRLVIDKREQKTLRYIRRLKEKEELPLRAIVERLNREKVPARGKQWHLTSVARVLKRAA